MRWRLTISVTEVAMWTLFVLLLSWPRSAIADESVDESTVRRWIVRLDADRRADRQRAEEELLRLGPEVLRWLPEPESLGSRSTAEAVRRVRAKLEKQAAERSVEASILMLPESTSLREVATQLSRQTGNVVVADGLPNDVLAREWKRSERTTFWDILESIRQQQGLIPCWDEVSPRVRFGVGQVPPERPLLWPGELASATSKAFRLSLRSAQWRSVAGANSQPLLRMELAVTSEPRLRPLFLKCAVDDLQLRSGTTPGGEGSANANRWQAFAPETKLEMTFGPSGRHVVVPLDFRPPASGRRDLVSLSGRLFVQTAATEVPIEFPAGAEAKGVSRRRGGVTVKVLEWNAQSDGDKHSLTVTASVAYDTGGPAFESHRSWMLFNVAGLVRSGMLPSEKPSASHDLGHLAMIKPRQLETDVQPDGGIAVSYQFTELPLPASEYRFRYIAPTLILDVPLDFELPNIKLPPLKAR